MKSKRYSLAALIAATCLLAATSASATEDDFNVWTGHFVVIDLGGDSDWFLRGEA
ncbi:MAG: hypothetical protein WA985_05105 [Erythrobacter sp.]